MCISQRTCSVGDDTGSSGGGGGAGLSSRVKISATGAAALLERCLSTTVALLAPLVSAPGPSFKAPAFSKLPAPREAPPPASWALVPPPMTILMGFLVAPPAALPPPPPPKPPPVPVPPPLPSPPPHLGPLSAAASLRPSTQPN